MKITKLVLVIGLAALGMACGYSRKTMPTMAGNMPMITAFNPTSATHGAQTSLEIDGTNFNQNAFATITLNGTSSKMTPTTTPSTTMIMVTIMPAMVMSAGTAQITITNPGQSGGIYGGGTTTVVSAPMSFTIN